MKKQLQKKIYSFIVTAMLFSIGANAQIVNIPDAVFKSKLVNNPAININGDAEIQVSEAAAYNGSLNVQSVPFQPKIQDFTGIQAFTAITGLNCSQNVITSLDVSYNTALTYLNCISCHLPSLNVSANTVLTYLNLDNNNLSSLNLSANTALTELHCGYNNLTSLNVAANTALTVLDCRHNSLTSLDVTANTALTTLACYVNQLTSLNVTANTGLSRLWCQINQLSSLDVSANAALIWLTCDSNQLTSLNVQNGNNSNFTTFNATGNPNLTCIQVDNAAYSNANWSAGKDATASFSTNCVTSVHDIGNSASVQIAPNPTTDYFTIALESNSQKAEVTITDITGKIIYKTIARDTQKLEVNIPNTIGNFPAGVYAVQIQSEDFIATKKLIIQK